MKTKRVWKSKSFWFGALFILNGLAQSFGYGDFVPSGDLSATTSYGVGLVTWVLRWVTNSKVKII